MIIILVTTTSNHTGLEGPDRVAFNRIVIFALTERTYIIITNITYARVYNIMFIIDRDRKTGVRYALYTARLAW